MTLLPQVNAVALTEDGSGVEVPAMLYEWAALAQYALSQASRTSSPPGEMPTAMAAIEAGSGVERLAPLECTPIGVPSAPQHFPLINSPNVLQPTTAEARVNEGGGECAPQPIRSRTAALVSMTLPNRRSIVGGTDEMGSWWWIRDYAAPDGDLHEIAWQLARMSRGRVNVMINGHSAYTFIPSSSGESA
ncbi:MAG TPA: hypothetical protein VM687_09935 [Stenotrophomonas sp.]|nr:hypothetical protein [Stenotrophomonas sp.]